MPYRSTFHWWDISSPSLLDYSEDGGRSDCIATRISKAMKVEDEPKLEIKNTRLLEYRDNYKEIEERKERERIVMEQERLEKEKQEAERKLAEKLEKERLELERAQKAIEEAKSKTPFKVTSPRRYIDLSPQKVSPPSTESNNQKKSSKPHRPQRCNSTMIPRPSSTAERSISSSQNGSRQRKITMGTLRTSRADSYPVDDQMDRAVLENYVVAIQQSMIKVRLQYKDIDSCEDWRDMKKQLALLSQYISTGNN